ncbi:MAG: orotate phosphoribosyltransferase [Bergeyella sp.]|nr:orotate phosphoribosyltransferase [Bergeyella sp.]
MMSKEDFFLGCYNLEIIKFGKFTLKSGMESPFYVDLRPLVSDPKILKILAGHLLRIVSPDNFDLICGVPYAALPMATAMSLESHLPLILKRKEVKSYGTKRLIEGLYKKGQNCLLVEDVITSGKSLIETIEEVEREDLKVTDVVVVLDREQGGKELLEKKGLRVHTLFTLTEACEILKRNNLLFPEDEKRIKDFLSGNKVEFSNKKRLSYAQKLEKVSHPVAKKILELALSKKSNLIASADVCSTVELLEIAEKIGPYIVALKTHVDILSDFKFDRTILPLRDLAEKHQFLLMEDRKFADIGSTQERQYNHGIYKISSWADIVTSQVIGGAPAMDPFLNSGVVAILSMSSSGALTRREYFLEAQKIAESHPNIIGGVTQHPLQHDSLLVFTPGVHLESKTDKKGQQYHSPREVFKRIYTDFIIVGRGIYATENPVKMAEKYRIIGWEAYLEDLS